MLIVPAGASFEDLHPSHHDTSADVLQSEAVLAHASIFMHLH
jgi:hypothetical protein